MLVKMSKALLLKAHMTTTFFRGDLFGVTVQEGGDGFNGSKCLLATVTGNSSAESASFCTKPKLHLLFIRVALIAVQKCL